MTYNQLLYFVTTVEYNSITQASKSLFVTQPAISVAIKSLEKEFNTTLFERHNNQLTLTESGEYLYKKAISIIDEFKDLEEDFKKYISLNKTLKIGIPPMIGTIWFPEIFNEYSKENPNIKLSTTEIGSLSLMEAVRNDEIDLAITSAPNINNKTIDSCLIRKTELYFCVNKEHHLAGEKRITIEKLEDEPIVLMKEDSYQYKIINQKFAEASIKPNIILNTNQLYTIKQLLLYNTAGAFMFKELVEKDPDLIGIPFDKPFIVEIILLWNKNRADNLVIKDFINFMESLKNK